MEIGSVDIAKASIKLAISSREEEEKLIAEFRSNGVLAVAVDIGGNINNSIPKIVERALVASKRTGVIKDCHVHEGGVAGATRDAIIELMDRANGMNVGGKIGIARHKEHLSVCIFMSIGLLNLNEVVIGLGHRAIPDL